MTNELKATNEILCKILEDFVDEYESEHYKEECCCKRAEDKPAFKDIDEIEKNLYEIVKSTLGLINMQKEDDEMVCPFCGSSVVAKMNDDGEWYDECIYCGTKTPAHFVSKHDAIEFWNLSKEEDE